MNIDFEGERYANLEPSALNLLKMMLKPNPSERFSATQALNHSFFTSARESEQGEKRLNSPCLTKASRTNRGNKVCK